jgi:hypothetical protein
MTDSVSTAPSRMSASPLRSRLFEQAESSPLNMNIYNQ